MPVSGLDPSAGVFVPSPWGAAARAAATTNVIATAHTPVVTRGLRKGLRNAAVRRPQEESFDSRQSQRAALPSKGGVPAHRSMVNAMNLEQARRADDQIDVAQRAKYVPPPMRGLGLAPEQLAAAQQEIVLHHEPVEPAMEAPIKVASEARSSATASDGSEPEATHPREQSQEIDVPITSAEGASQLATKSPAGNIQQIAVQNEPVVSSASQAPAPVVPQPAKASQAAALASGWSAVPRAAPKKASARAPAQTPKRAVPPPQRSTVAARPQPPTEKDFPSLGAAPKRGKASAPPAPTEQDFPALGSKPSRDNAANASCAPLEQTAWGKGAAAAREAKKLAQGKANAASEAKAKAETEAEVKLKVEAEARAKAEGNARAAAEAKTESAAEARGKEEHEMKANAEAEEDELVKRNEEAAANAEAEAAEAKRREEAAAKAKADAEAKRQEEAAAKAKADAEAAEARRREEAAAKAKADAEAERQEEAAAKAKAEAKAAEAERQEEAAAKAKAEAEAAEAKRREEAAAKANADAEAKRVAEVAAKAKVEAKAAEAKRKEKAAAKAKAEAEAAEAKKRADAAAKAKAEAEAAEAKREAETAAKAKAEAEAAEAKREADTAAKAKAEAEAAEARRREEAAATARAEAEAKRRHTAAKAKADAKAKRKGKAAAKAKAQAEAAEAKTRDEAAAKANADAEAKRKDEAAATAKAGAEAAEAKSKENTATKAKEEAEAAEAKKPGKAEAKAKAEEARVKVETEAKTIAQKEVVPGAEEPGTPEVFKVGKKKKQKASGKNADRETSAVSAGPSKPACEVVIQQPATETEGSTDDVAAAIVEASAGGQSAQDEVAECAAEGDPAAAVEVAAGEQPAQEEDAERAAKVEAAAAVEAAAGEQPAQKEDAECAAKVEAAAAVEVAAGGQPAEGEDAESAAKCVGSVPTKASKLTRHELMGHRHVVAKDPVPAAIKSFVAKEVRPERSRGFRKLDRENEAARDEGSWRSKEPTFAKKTARTLPQKESLSRDAQLDRQALAMLNKICPENVKGLAGKLKELDVESSAELERVIVQIFKKALKEPHYCETYADLVFYLRGEMPEFPNPDGGKPVSFKSTLLNIVQAEFENMPVTLHAPEDEGLDNEEMDFNRKQRKDKILSNMKFIGHLFLRNLLPAKIIGHVMQELACCNEAERFPEEHVVECLVELMLTIGYTLDSSDFGNRSITQVCGRLMELKKAKSAKTKKDVYAKRVQFSIQDLLDIRKAGWEKKVFKAAAKTMEEVKQDQQDGKGTGAGDKVILGTRPSYLSLDGSKREEPGSRRSAGLEGFAEVRRKR